MKAGTNFRPCGRSGWRLSALPLEIGHFGAIKDLSGPSYKMMTRI